MTAPLWKVDAMIAAMGARAEGALPSVVNGLSIDSRTAASGDAFFAIKGDAHDGHAFVAAALKAGAGLAVVAAEKAHEMPQGAPLLIVPDVLDAMNNLARAARARSRAAIVAVTGSVGKTSTKEALRIALSSEGETHASVASFNNHWGVPLSLARLSQDARFGVFEIGMNHAGEITPLTRLVRPRVAIITTVEPVHLEFFPSVEAIADAKAEIFLGIEPGGAAVLNRDNPHFVRLAAAAKAVGVARIVSFGAHEEADARLFSCDLAPDGSTIEAAILGEGMTYKIGAPGRHQAINSLAVLAAARLLDADLASCAQALARWQPGAGRGARATLRFANGEAVLIDESYNANPSSMAAALALLSETPVGRDGRRIAILGDMLELGPSEMDLHRGLAAVVENTAVDLVFCAGPRMAALWNSLPSRRRGGYAESSAELEPRVLAAVRAGDTVMVKGSLGSRMGPVVKALMREHDGTPREAPAQG